VAQVVAQFVVSKAPNCSLIEFVGKVCNASSIAVKTFAISAQRGRSGLEGIVTYGVVIEIDIQLAQIQSKNRLEFWRLQTGLQLAPHEFLRS